jgi:hypothetical protein
MNIVAQALTDGRAVLYVATETHDTIHARAACLLNALANDWKVENDPLTRWADIRSNLDAWRAVVVGQREALENLYVLPSSKIEAVMRMNDQSAVDVIAGRARALMKRDQSPPLVVVDFLQMLPIDARTDLTRGVGDLSKELATRVADPDDDNPEAWPGTTVLAALFDVSRMGRRRGGARRFEQHAAQRAASSSARTAATAQAACSASI